MSHSRITISSDEGQTHGYMLDDEHAPKTDDERVAMFCFLAAHEWDLLVDPRKLGAGTRMAAAFDEEQEELRAARDGEEIDSHWYVFTGLDEATL